MIGLLLPAAVVIVATAAVSRLADRLRPWLATWALSTLSVAVRDPRWRFLPPVRRETEGS